MSRKRQRGILGYNKDPKNQILFSFNVRKGDEWPSDESDDSDYLPDDSSSSLDKKKNSLSKVRKRCKHSKKKKHKEADGQTELSDKSDTRSKNSSKTEFDAAVKNLSVPSLPPEIWLKIFHFAVNSGGALPFLCRAAKVCHLWHEHTCHPSLWQKVDLSYGWIKAQDQTINWLCSNRLSQCRSINLSSWKKLSTSAIKLLAEKCPLLESINLSYCTKLSSDAVISLVDQCKDLAELELAFTSTDATSPSCLNRVLGSVGSHLRLLNIGGNNFKAFAAILNQLMISCCNLEHLDISNASFSSDFVSLSIEKLQTSCRKLRVIRFANSKFRATAVTQKTESSGFPDLEELSLAVSDTTTTGMNVGLGINDNFIQRMLVTSTKLRLLDLRGCGNLTSSALLSLPACSVQQLYLSQSSVIKSNSYQDFKPLITKWRHSLTDLDLSWNSYPTEILDVALKALASGSVSSPIHTLNLAGTSVSIMSIRFVLKRCPSLNSINLTSCRGLPRGIKRDFSGKQFLQLKQDLT